MKNRILATVPILTCMILHGTYLVPSLTLWVDRILGSELDGFPLLAAWVPILTPHVVDRFEHDQSSIR